MLGLAPWNAPVILAVRAIAAPLACGNTVVLKGSEICPRTHRLIGEVFRAAGLGEGVVNVVSNAPADASRIVEALIAHPTVRRVNFTGSTRVGRQVAELAARHLKPALLELGGKAPLIVLDDADLDEAVAAAAFGAFMNQGQICMSTERLIVDEQIADEFAARLAAKAATLVAGDPRKAKTPLGAIVSFEAAERIVGLVRDAVAKGARILAGGGANGVLMDATVLDHVTPAMRIYGEESFGPVAAIIRVGGVEEAVRVANDSEYGLAAAVFGRDLTRAFAVARRIESGICHINGPTVQDEAQMPFGGVKASGLRALRRRRRHPRVHRAALDHHWNRPEPVSDLRRKKELPNWSCQGSPFVINKRHGAMGRPPRADRPFTGGNDEHDKGFADLVRRRPVAPHAAHWRRRRRSRARGGPAHFRRRRRQRAQGRLHQPAHRRARRLRPDRRLRARRGAQGARHGLRGRRQDLSTSRSSTWTRSPIRRALASSPRA